MTCRVCFKDSIQKLEIFSNSEGQKNIAAILEKHLWFTVTSLDDQETQFVCVECWTKIDEFDEFYETVKRVHEKKIKDSEEETLAIEVKKEDIVDDLSKIDKSFEDDDLYVTVVIDEIDFLENENYFQNDEEIVKNIETEILRNEDEISISTQVTETQKELVKTSSSKKIKRSSKPQSKPKGKRAERARITAQDDQIVSKHISLHCELCNFTAEIFQDIVKHFESDHSSTRPFINCCGRRFTKRERVVQHAWLHEDPEHFQCPICKRAFRDNEIKNAHMKAQHPTEEELIHSCDQCEKRFARGYLLKLHKAVHVPVDEREFFCHKCTTPKAFASQNQLNIHNSMKHNRALNICDVCGKTIRDRKAFKKHVRLHFEDSGPRIKCPHAGCESWLKDRDNLKQHLRLHKNNVESLQCDECDKLCKDRRALTCHKRAVHPTTLFSCDICSRNFKKAISLREHKATHTGEALYECPFCTQKFKSNANMHAHKKKMHPEEWAICKNLKNR